MAQQTPDSTPPALDLLRSIATRSVEGRSQRELVADGWSVLDASRLLDALRSRGYVRLDRATSRWIATEAGLHRAVELPAQPPPFVAPS